MSGVFGVPLSLVASVVVIGLVHGAEPGHGWPVAATYALDSSHRWLAGLAAGLVIGVGHLVSSIAVVAAFLLLASAVDITQYEWVARYVAGVLLVALGVRELTGGHHHGRDVDPGHGDHDVDPGHGDHDAQSTPHGHGDEDRSASLTSVTAGPADPPGHETAGFGHTHDHGDPDGWLHRVRHALPIGDHSHGDQAHGDHSHGDQGHGHGHALGEGSRSHFGSGESESLLGLAVAAFALGFAHEEEFQILGFCTGATEFCVPLMLLYAVAVIVALVTLTLLLVAGFEHFEEDVEQYADYFPYLSGGVLVLMGLGFLLGVL